MTIHTPEKKKIIPATLESLARVNAVGLMSGTMIGLHIFELAPDGLSFNETVVDFSRNSTHHLGFYCPADEEGGAFFATVHMLRLITGQDFTPTVTGAPAHTYMEYVRADFHTANEELKRRRGTQQPA